VCRSAFKALAYKKYQQVPLYLEWAPKDIWDTPAPAAAAAATAKPAAKPAAAPAVDSKAAAGSAAADPAAGDAAAASNPAAAAAAAGDEGDEEDGTAAPVACIYVKNLNFATGDAALRKHFDKAVSAAGGSIHSAKVGAVHFTAEGRVTGMTSLAAQHVTSVCWAVSAGLRELRLCCVWLFDFPVAVASFWFAASNCVAYSTVTRLCQQLAAAYTAQRWEACAALLAVEALG
jgi:hypothetical protein